MNITELRRKYHEQLCTEIIRVTQKGKTEYPNFADGTSKISTAVAWGIVQRIGCFRNINAIPGQSAGKRFEVVTKDFLQDSFSLLTHLRPGEWNYSCENTEISNFDQYAHLSYIEGVLKDDATLSSAFGGNYIVRPDIVIGRMPIDDRGLGRQSILDLSDTQNAKLTPLRRTNQTSPILHAVISCKWTIRNDRAQNTRTEALNLIRNRKGNLPHVVAITAEPFPSRIAALALGTGDLDCVYHFALTELLESVAELGNEESQTILQIMVDGRRLRDISDLPFDLAV